jgi:hypothetical protein
VVRLRRRSERSPGTIVSHYVQKVARSWPFPLRKCFRLFIQGSGCSTYNRLTVTELEAECSIWLLITQWLNQRLECGQDLIHQCSLLSDAIFAQACLGLLVRIHDDRADGAADDPILPVVAHQLHIEAERALARHLSGDAAFWEYFRGALEETAWNAVRVAEWQRNPRTDPKKLQRGYAAQAAILSVGSAAVCHAAGRTDLLPEVRRFGAAMTVAGQVLDDVRDLGEDLAQGKVNLAANLLLRAAERAGVPAELTVETLAESAVRSGGFQDILNLVARQLIRAKAAVRRLELPEAVALVERYQAWPAAMRERIHRRRVDAFFSLLKD